MSKYKNKKVVFDGMTFDSKKECERYKVLKAWQEMGVIGDLRTQVVFELARGIKITGESKKRPSVRYVADFVYVKDGVQVVEDVKSAITRKDKVYRLKKHLMKLIHDIDVVEV